jgi:DNA helicase HerA-like ATPase
MEECGQIIAGHFGKILIREKSGQRIELGDLLVSEDNEGYSILQVFGLIYGSQIAQPSRELIAGMRLEGMGSGLEFLEPQLRNYIIAEAKAVLRVFEGKPNIPKELPEFFSSVRHITEKDLNFLVMPDNPIYLGKVRSGTKIIDKANIYLNGSEALNHHILIPSTTGRGKSNLVKVMLWSTIGQKKFGILVLDPHDEYYGRNGKGLKDHPKSKGNLLYYSTNPPAGSGTLIVNLNRIKPQHFSGIISFSNAQYQTIGLYQDAFSDKWIENIVLGNRLKDVKPETLSVLKRIIQTHLSVYIKDEQLICANRVFSNTAGESTIHDIVQALQDGKVVIIDTSKIGDAAELIIGSIIADEIFYRYQEYKSRGELETNPPVSVVIEEAPRVLGREKLEKGDNIYSRIAREGRKFNVGLMAITQLTSVIPTDILTNMNTKIILGNEMEPERQAIISSAAQDLSEDHRNIASLEKGEAIVSSIFTKFAVPIKIPRFDEFIKQFESRQTTNPFKPIEYIG